VKITPGHFDWKDVKLLRDITDDISFGQWFAATGNRLKFVDASSELIEATTSSFPKLPMVPAEIGMKLVQRPTTPWELMELLTNYGKERGNTMHKLLEPVLMWTMLACL